MRDDVVHRPTWQRRRRAPLRFSQSAGQRADVLPHREQSREHRRLVEKSDWTRGVVHPGDGTAHGTPSEPKLTLLTARVSQPAAIIATEASASTMPTACQRVTRSRNTTMANSTVAAG